MSALPSLLLILCILFAAWVICEALARFTGSMSNRINRDTAHEGIAALPPDGTNTTEAVCPDCDLAKISGVWKKVSGREYWKLKRSGAPLILCTGCKQIAEEIRIINANRAVAHNTDLNL